MPIDVKQVRGLPDFAPLYKWDLAVTTGPAAIDTPGGLNVRCLSTDVPKAQAGQTIEVGIRGIYKNQSGIYQYNGSITLAFAETVDNTIKQWLTDWREACYNSQDGTAAPQADIEANILLTMLDRQDQAIWKYELIGVFLEDYDHAGSQLDGETSDIQRPSITVRYDTFKDSPA